MTTIWNVAIQQVECSIVTEKFQSGKSFKRKD